MDPAIERIEDRGRCALHFDRLGQIAKSIQETAHRDLGRLAAALGAANSIGDRRHHVAARLRQLRAENRAGEILIAFARSGLRDEPDTYLDAGNPLSHRRSNSRPAAWIVTRWQAQPDPGSRPQFSSLQR